MNQIAVAYKAGDTVVLVDLHGEEHEAKLGELDGELTAETSFATRYLRVFENEGYRIDR